MVMSAGTPETPAEENAALPYKPPRRWFVFLSLTAAAVVFVVCMIVLVYRGVTAVDPKSVIVVLGNENWKGASVTVSGGELARPLEAQLQDYNKYQVPFFVGRGNFTVRIERGSFSDSQSVELKQDHLLATWSLSPDGPITQTRR